MYCSSRWGSAPTRRRPLTKIVGVLLTSSCWPFARLALTAAPASGMAKRGRVIHLDHCPILREGVFRHIRQLTPEEILAILADVKFDHLLIVANREVDSCFEQPFDR